MYGVSIHSFRLFAYILMYVCLFTVIAGIFETFEKNLTVFDMHASYEVRTMRLLSMHAPSSLECVAEEQREEESKIFGSKTTEHTDMNESQDKRTIRVP